MTRAEFGSGPEGQDRKTPQTERQMPNKPRYPGREFKPLRYKRYDYHSDQSLDEVRKAAEQRAEAEQAHRQLQRQLQGITDPYAATIRQMAVDLELDKRNEEQRFGITRKELAELSNTIESQDKPPKNSPMKDATQKIWKKMRRQKTPEEPPQEEPEEGYLTLTDERGDRRDPVPVRVTYQCEEGDEGFYARPLSYEQNLNHGYGSFQFKPDGPQIRVAFDEQEEIAQVDVAFKINQYHDSLGDTYTTMVPPEMQPLLKALYPREYKQIQSQYALSNRKNDLTTLSLTFGETTKVSLSFQAHDSDYELTLDYSNPMYSNGPTEKDVQRLEALTEALFSFIPAAPESPSQLPQGMS